MYKFFLVPLFCLFTICTDAHNKREINNHIQEENELIFQGVDFLYPFILFNK